MDFHELSKTIDQALPGEGLWAQSAADEDVVASESGEIPAEGLAIRREASWWLVVFFRVVPSEARDGPGCWEVEVGYTGAHDTLGEAKAEARELLRHLPRMGFPDEEKTQDFIFAALDDLEVPDR